MRTRLSRLLLAAALASSFGCTAPCEAAAVTHTYRVEDDDRYATAASVATTMFPLGSGTVVIGSGSDETLVNGQLGMSLAGALNVPILFTGTDRLDPHTAAAITSLGATEALIVGGTHSVSTEVEASLVGMGLTVRRFGGDTLLQDSLQVAKATQDLGGGMFTGRAFLVSADPSVDWRAVYAVAPNAYRGNPILFTDHASLPAETLQAIRETGITMVGVLGSEAYISDAVLTQLRTAGATPFRIVETSRKGLAEAAADFSAGTG